MKNIFENKKTPENFVEGYVAGVLDSDSQDKLLTYIGSSTDDDGKTIEHENKFAHHTTISYRPPKNEYNKMIEENLINSEIEFIVTEIVSNEKCVSAKLPKEGMTKFMQNENPHITISTNKGISPVYSNQLLSLPEDEITITQIEPLVIKVKVSLEEFPKNEIK